MAHICLEMVMPTVSTSRSVWSEPMPNHKPRSVLKITGSTSPLAVLPTTSIDSRWVSSVAAPR
ncbi:hypothetical protein D3C86_1428330 [compost metagenome]